MNPFTDNIYIAAIVVDYEAASHQQDYLLEVLRDLSDIDTLQEDSPLAPFVRLDVFNPYSPNGRIRHRGGGSDAGDSAPSPCRLA